MHPREVKETALKRGGGKVGTSLFNEIKPWIPSTDSTIWKYISNEHLLCLGTLVSDVVFSINHLPAGKEKSRNKDIAEPDCGSASHRGEGGTAGAPSGRS